MNVKFHYHCNAVALHLQSTDGVRMPFLITGLPKFHSLHLCYTTLILS